MMDGIKMHWNNLVFRDEFNITGRGKVVVVELKGEEINLGDTISYSGEMYKISGIEMSKNLFNGKTNPLVGLILRDD